jgi:hypothetical protein
VGKLSEKLFSIILSGIVDFGTTICIAAVCMGVKTKIYRRPQPYLAWQEGEQKPAFTEIGSEADHEILVIFASS